MRRYVLLTSSLAKDMLSNCLRLTTLYSSGHYVYNGMITSLYWKNNAVVVPSPGSSFDQYLYENDICTDGTTSCTGTAFDFVQWFFGGQYAASRRDYVVSGVVLGVFLILPRLCTWFALKYIRFSS